MKNIILSLSLAAFFLSTQCALAADTVKLKHVGSSYSDTTEIGLKAPEGVSCNDPYLYVADTGNSRLLRYTYKDDALLVDKVFPVDKAVPIQVQVNSKDEFFYLDGKDRTIVPLTATGKPKGTMSFKGIPGGTKVVPKSFRIDNKDNLYVLDVFSERVLVVDGKGTFLQQLPFPEKYGFISDLTIDNKGSIYLLDSINVEVYRSVKGEAFNLLASDISEYLNFPTSLSVDGRGRIFLVDQYGSGMVLIAADGSFSGRKIGMGWVDGLLYYPTQACLNDEGDLFVADRSNSRVQHFTQVE